MVIPDVSTFWGWERGAAAGIADLKTDWRCFWVGNHECNMTKLLESVKFLYNFYIVEPADLNKNTVLFFHRRTHWSLKRGSPLPKPKMHHIASIPQLPGSFVTFCRVERANKKCWTSLAWVWLRHTTSQRTPLHTLPGQTSCRINTYPEKSWKVKVCDVMHFLCNSVKIQ